MDVVARRRRWRRALAGLAGLAAISGLILVYLVYAPVGDVRPHPFNQDRNAVWLEHRWLEVDHAEDEIAALVRSLDARGVRYVFPHLIPFDREGRLPPHSREQMRRFLATARRIAPRMRVLPWVGGLQVGHRRTREGTIALSDLVQRQQIIAECRSLIDEGFHGVHFNVEPLDDGNVDFLSLLRAVRAAVEPGGILSIAAIRPAPLSLPLTRNFLWTFHYYRRLARIVDQVVVMSYDTALPTAEAYRRYVAYASAEASRVLSDSPARLLLGVPTYDPTGIMHRADVETPEHALAGIVSGLRGVGAGGTFEGVALYAEWTTDAAEWETYERVWRGR